MLGMKNPAVPEFAIRMSPGARNCCILEYIEAFVTASPDAPDAGNGKGRELESSVSLDPQRRRVARFEVSHHRPRGSAIHGGKGDPTNHPNGCGSGVFDTSRDV
jgi:hypothetical protein